MTLRDLIVSTAVLDGDQIPGKAELFRILLDRLAAAGLVPTASIDSIVERLLGREALGTTGIGLGIAIPHTRHPDVIMTMGMLAVCHPPLWYESLDGEPADIIVLYLAPTDRRTADARETTYCSHRLLQQLRDEEFRQTLRGLKTGAEIADLLAQIE